MTPASATGRTVLYIEDNAANILVMEGVFKRLDGFELTTVNNGAEGIKRAKSMKPDVILLDLYLPGMDGFQVFEVLRGDEGTAKIPVIAITAAAVPELIQEAMDMGFDAYVTKPFDFRELVALINKQIRAR